MQSFIFSSTFMIFLLANITDAFSLRRHYRRPICEPTQSCSYNFKSFTFELCDCPDMRECPMSLDFGVELKGITYQFCVRRQLPVCRENEISAEVLDIQTSIFCICPKEMMYIKKIEEFDTNVQYICKEKTICKTENTCGHVNYAGKLSPTCICPNGSICVPEDQSHIPTASKQAINATCQPV